MREYRYYTFKELYDMLLEKHHKSLAWKFIDIKVHFNYVVVDFDTRTHSEPKEYCHTMALEFCKKYSNKRFYFQRSNSDCIEKFIITQSDEAGFKLDYN